MSVTITTTPDDGSGNVWTTLDIQSIGITRVKTNNFRWLRRGWFRKVLQQASVTQYGDVWWDDVPTETEP